MTLHLISLVLIFNVLNYSLAIEPIVLVHGGAGTIGQSSWPRYFDGTILAVRTGYNELMRTGNVLDAVEAAIRSMETDVIFNAGYGSVLTRAGEIEMDAMIMDGSNMEVGAITGIQDIFHPISLARKVMEKSEHNFFGPSGAKEWAKSEGFQILPPGTLETPSRRGSLDRWLIANNLTLLTDLGGDTVGAVAIDEHGNIAAGTSTGGITGKLSGRVGDAPLVGSGTYADNTLGGISATGTGEVIMKSVLVYDVLLRAKYKGETLNVAAQTACDLMLERHRASGGVIALSPTGEVGIGFSSNQMAWAYQKGQKVYYGVDRNQTLEMDLND